MKQIQIPDDVVREAFAEALRMPLDTGAHFLQDLRTCFRRSLLRFLPQGGFPPKNDREVGDRSQRIATVWDVAPIRHFSSRYRKEYVINAEFCYGYQFKDNSLTAINYICGGI